MVISGSVNVAANSTSANVLLGLVGSTIRVPSAVSLKLVSDGTGQSATFNVDDNAVLIGANIPQSPGAGQGPRDPEDVVVRNSPGPAGSILSLTVQNTTAAAVVTRFIVETTPLM